MSNKHLRKCFTSLVEGKTQISKKKYHGTPTKTATIKDNGQYGTRTFIHCSECVKWHNIFGTVGMAAFCATKHASVLEPQNLNPK